MLRFDISIEYQVQGTNELLNRIVHKKLLILCKMKMMLTKEKLKKTIDSMPDNITVDEVIDRIILLDKVEKGLDDVEQDKVYTTSEVKERLNKWLK